MSIEAYSQGTIKVVWLGDDLNTIHSQMCKTVKQAEEIGKSHGDFLIFKLLKQNNMESFSWELLPRGNYSMYKKIMQFNRWLKQKPFA